MVQDFYVLGYHNGTILNNTKSSILPHVHLSSMHLCCRQYVSIACIAFLHLRYSSPMEGEEYKTRNASGNMRHQKMEHW